MAKLYFYYSAMNAGKSTILLQSSYNYRERGMQTIIMAPEIDTRSGGKVVSWIGIESDAILFDAAENLHSKVIAQRDQQQLENLKCVLIDEAQFLTRRQVMQLCEVCDNEGIPVLTYGIRTDFQGHLFDGSQALLALADSLVELKTICHCGRKATMNLRIDTKGQPIKDGNQVQIGGNESYQAVCRKHFYAGMSFQREDELPLL